jgi:transcriptional regulator with XRE-family HTH domain
MLTMLKERLKIARKRAHLTQQEAADAIGVTRTAIAHWERGSSNPGHDNLVQIAGAYGVSVEWLLDDDADQAVAPQENGASLPCDRAVLRTVAANLYQTLEIDGLAMEPSDFAGLLLVTHDWATEEIRLGRVIDLERIRWFVRVAKSYRRQ